LALCHAVVGSPYSLDHMLGLQYFTTDTLGIGGRLRCYCEDFLVEELPKEFPSCKEGDYVHFTLEKRNWETIAAVKSIAKSLGVSSNRFGYAGNKDKRALTRQRVAVWGVKPDRLKEVRIEGIRISDLVVSDSRLHLGDLEGNRFRIVVRNPDLTIDRFDETLRGTREQINANGVPNYYGYQRFGTIRPNTHLVGKKLVLGDVEGAVMSYLGSPCTTEKEDAEYARHYVDQTRDYPGALRLYPKRLGYERAMLDHLTKNHSDYVGAIRRLPKRLGRLLVQAYQSYLFNRILSTITETELEIGNSFLPLIGFRTDVDDGPEREIVKTVLDREGVTPRDFYIRAIPELSSEGTIRRASVKVNPHFTVQEKNNEERKVTFEFSLPAGSYATIVLREFMKTDPSSY
jgi:tRNA pseudouridine13 synthase